ncbi:MAG TPA: heme ABC exporter ATP-binding protein CcmA [Vicinamibacterales bacterium]|nr:heme ABC exporter ATP-binding protein CcmA [Vicinamibacterales bacterium]
MIAAAGLTRVFGGRTAVDAVTLNVRAGEILALLGPNGAGKTTTMRMLAGLIAPTSGTVALDGVPLTPATGGTLRARIGFLTESPGLWDRLTVRENLRVYARVYGVAEPDARIEGALRRLELDDHANARAAELSKGMRQKVAIARALLHDPKILLLDEPTSGLDPAIARSVRHLLEERRAAGCAVLVSTHNLDEAERLADRVAVLQRTLLAIDTPAALRRRLTTGRLLVRVVGDPAAFVAAVGHARAHVDGAHLVVDVNGEEETPAIVSALVAAGARIVEVRPEMPALEEVYLQLVAPADGAQGPR